MLSPEVSSTFVTSSGVFFGIMAMKELSLNILDVAENSTRAKASLVTIIVDANTAEDRLAVTISDDGCGMDREDAQKAFLIHATSKLHSIEDIYSLSTMGFRGEALASIAACSDVTLTTCIKGEKTGTKVVYEDGSRKGIYDHPEMTGTSVEVRNLFKNLPARYKFLKKDSTEGMYITGLVEKLSIINPQVSIKLIKDGAVQFTTPGTGSVQDAVYAVYGKETASNLVPVKYQQDDRRVQKKHDEADVKPVQSLPHYRMRTSFSGSSSLSIRFRPRINASTTTMTSRESVEPKCQSLDLPNWF